MESEALRNIRTMRQVKSSFEVARKQKIKTTSSLFKTIEENERLESIGKDNGQTTQILAQEKARAAKFEASVEKSRQKLLKSREKIKSLVDRNRALTNLRHEIQQDRDHTQESPSLSKQSVVKREISKRGLHGMELKY